MDDVLWEPPILKVMKQALGALEESRDDVLEMLNGLEHGKGYPSYDRRIKGYTEQLARHDAAIVALQSAIRSYWL